MLFVAFEETDINWFIGFMGENDFDICFFEVGSVHFNDFDVVLIGSFGW